jgi:hypothetical protein
MMRFQLHFERPATVVWVELLQAPSRANASIGLTAASEPQNAAQCAEANGGDQRMRVRGTRAARHKSGRWLAPQDVSACCSWHAHVADGGPFDTLHAEASQGDDDNPLAVKGAPGESFQFSLQMDARDMLADGSPVAVGIASLSGIYTRIAALEMLMQPTGSAGDSLLGSVSVSVGSAGISAGASAGAKKRTIPNTPLPTVLFVWGLAASCR